MGFLSDMVKDARLPGGSPDGRELWRQTFRATAKEDPRPDSSIIPPDRLATRSRSLSTTNAGWQRLLAAMRSRAPGGWSDDRWEQTIRHFVGIQYVAIHRTGELLSQSEFQVFQTDDNHPDGKRPITPYDPPQGEHRAMWDIKPYDLVRLLEKPNQEDSFGDWMYQVNQQMDLNGTALSWMVPSQVMVPMEMYIIPTPTAIPGATVNQDYPNGYYRIQPIYPYGPFTSYPTPTSAIGANIPTEWMLRVKYPHPLLRYDGYSPQTALKLHIDEVEMMDRSRHYSMRRGIKPSAVLNFEAMEGAQPLPEEEIERIHAEFEADWEGPENAGKVYVATPGASLEEFGSRPVDMDYQAGWEQLVSFVMAGFGITKPAAGMIDDSSYSTLFATLKQFHLLTLEPKCSRIARKLTRQLAPYFGDNLIVEIRCKRIDDHEVRNAKINLAMKARAIKKNEVRKLLDMPVTPEPWGEEFAGEATIDPMTGQPVANPAMANPTQPGPLGLGGRTPVDQLVPSELEIDTNATPADSGMPAQTAEPSPIALGRPRVGNMGRGSVGMRKSAKSIYEQVQEMMGNGH